MASRWRIQAWQEAPDFCLHYEVSRLDAIAAAWAAKKCVVACPASLCPVAAGGACGKDGTCADVGEL